MRYLAHHRRRALGRAYGRASTRAVAHVARRGEGWRVGWRIERQVETAGSRLSVGMRAGSPRRETSPSPLVTLYMAHRDRHMYKKCMCPVGVCGTQHPARQGPTLTHRA
eukprot:4384591-Prymnesium_polylepis.1